VNKIQPAKAGKVRECSLLVDPENARDATLVNHRLHRVKSHIVVENVDLEPLLEVKSDLHPSLNSHPCTVTLTVEY
jgi:hypothetical protein